MDLYASEQEYMDEQASINYDEQQYYQDQKFAEHKAAIRDKEITKTLFKMAHNINTFKLKKIEKLNIPIEEFFKHEREDFHPVKKAWNGKENSIVLDWSNEEIAGILKDGILNVTHINISGEFSGYVYDFLIKALSKSTGKLEVVTIWEGGDSIEKLIFNDGIIEQIPIEL